MSLRRRLERSTLLARLLGGMLALWLRLCDRTTGWQTEGLDDLERHLARGPVVLVLWHECSALAPVHWPVRAGPLSSLYAASPIGRVSGAVQAAFGLQAIEMADGRSNRSPSREVLRRLREGVSVGLTGDGPLGPARIVKDAPLDWARASGRPVFLYAFATRRGRRLSTWDRMILPRPFDRGVKLFRLWHEDLPRRIDPEEAARLAAGMKAALDDLTDEAVRRSRG